MNRLLIFVVGPKRSGKSTFSMELAVALNGVVAETGDVVRREYRRLLGTSPEVNGDKELYRPDLEHLGDLMTSRCKCRLVELILADEDFAVSMAPLVITGIRRRAEFFEALELAESNGYQIRTVFIDPPWGVDDAHFEVLPSDCATVFENSGDAEDLEILASQYALNGCPEQMEKSM